MKLNRYCSVIMIDRSIRSWHRLCHGNQDMLRFEFYIKVDRLPMKRLISGLTTALFLLILCNTASLGAVPKADENASVMLPEGIIVAQDSEGLGIETPFYVEFPEIVFTFDKIGSKYYFLKISYIVEAANQIGVELLNTKQSEILDEIYKYLRNMNPDDLSGNNAIYRIKELLFSRISEVAGDAEIHDVLIQQFLLQ